MYKFALEPVLNHRKALEEGIQRELAAIERLAAYEKKKLKVFINRKKSLASELRQKQERGISILESILYVDFIRRLSVQIEKQSELVLAFEKDVNRKREDLIDAVKKRKSLEKLDEKGFRAYMRKALKDEQNFMNEVAVNRFIRTA